eukprot:1098137-Rhodomonas_salina.2
MVLWRYDRQGPKEGDLDQQRDGPDRGRGPRSARYRSGEHQTGPARGRYLFNLLAPCQRERPPLAPQAAAPGPLPPYGPAMPCPLASYGPGVPCPVRRSRMLLLQCLPTGQLCHVGYAD